MRESPNGRDGHELCSHSPVILAYKSSSVSHSPTSRIPSQSHEDIHSTEHHSLPCIFPEPTHIPSSNNFHEHTNNQQTAPNTSMDPLTFHSYANLNAHVVRTNNTCDKEQNEGTQDMNCDLENNHHRRKRHNSDGLKNSIGESVAKKMMTWAIVTVIACASLLPATNGDAVGVPSNWDRPSGMPKIAHLEVMCGAQHMEVHLSFDSPFHGLVASKGMYGHDGCVYVHPRTGQTSFVFNIYYDKCGTKPDNNGKFYENTVVVQYDEELIEAWDEAKRLRCEWFNDYEKTATKTSPMVISDLDIVELNFHGDNVDCWMEIQEGKGPWAPPLTGIVPLGSTLTMVVAVKDPTGEFDMRVKACEASDGQSGHVLPLSDPEGCIIRPKLIGKFSKLKLDDGRATVLTYAFLSAFKFPDMLNVHLRCTVEICRHGCPDHCSAAYGTPANGIDHLGLHSGQDPIALQSQINHHAEINPNDITNEESDNENVSLKPDIHHLDPIHIPHLTLNEQSRQPLIQEQPPQQQQLPQPPQQPQQSQQQDSSGHSGEVFDANTPQQMQPPPPLPQFFESKRVPRPGGRPGKGRPGHSKHISPPTVQNRPAPNHKPFPQFIRYPPPPPGYNGPPQQPAVFPQRFTGTIQHTIGSQGPPDPNFIQQQQHHHSQRVQNMLMRPEPKNDNDDELNGGQDIYIDKKSGELASEAPSESQPQSSPLKGDPILESRQGEIPINEPVYPSAFPKGPRRLRFRRSVASNSDVVGVQGAFRVVSQADLDFALNSTGGNDRYQPTVTMTGKMARPDELIYGICLPRVGFGIVFFGLGLATLVAILIAAFLAYAHYKVHHLKQTADPCGNNGPVSLNGPSSLPPHMGFQQCQPMFPMVILRKMW